jgi:hypothetical protein
MGFQLPVLETDVDCEPLGYPGLTFTFWLNATNPEEDWVSPAERDPPVQKPAEWDRLWYEGLGRVLLRVIIPPKLSDTGAEEVLEIPDAEAVYELERMPGFDKTLLHWAFARLSDERQERIQVAAKN